LDEKKETLEKVGKVIRSQSHRLEFYRNSSSFDPLLVYRFILIGSTLSHKSKCLFSSHVESRVENVRWGGTCFSLIIYDVLLFWPIL